MIERIKARKAEEGEGGFTLIELLVVIIILGILAAVVVFSVGGITDRGEVASCKIETRTLSTAEEAYWAKTTPGSYTDAATLAAPAPVGGLLSALPTIHNITEFGPPTATTAGYFVIRLSLTAPTKCGGTGVAPAADTLTAAQRATYPAGHPCATAAGNCSNVVDVLHPANF